jgi:hypothetical protein
MLAIMLSMAKTRLGLLAVEARLELNSIWLLLALTVLALIFVAMFLLMLSLFVIMAYWETSRLLAIGCLLSRRHNRDPADPAAQGKERIEPVRSQSQRTFQGPLRA